MRIIPAIITSLFISLSGYAQMVVRHTVRIPVEKAGTGTGRIMSIEAGEPVSSLCLRIPAGQDPGRSRIVAGSDTFLITRNEHIHDEAAITSNLVIFREPVRTIAFDPGLLRDTVEICMVLAGPVNFPAGVVVKPALKTLPHGLKSMPWMIDQSIWRAGLPEPRYERIHNVVRNVIVHHSATSNLVTDYTSAIRNIYVYHTEINGWSDIGYNYIVSPDGAIYKGRDPGSYPQDEVLGAHFCSRNTGTLGICVLGTYSYVYPSDTAMGSLERLVVWKLAKDHLDPLGLASHPLNPDLDVIAGHRDGCATLCPGDSLYTDLGVLRNRVHEAMMLLGTGLDDRHISLFDPGLEVRLYPNPAAEEIRIETAGSFTGLEIIDAMGQVVLRREGDSRSVHILNLMPGWYLLVLHTPERTLFQRFLKI